MVSFSIMKNRPSVNKAEIFTKLARVLYAQIRNDNSQPTSQFYHKNALNRLSTGHLDTESLWNQIDIENKFFVKKFVYMFCEDQDAEQIIKGESDFFQRSSQLVSDSEEDDPDCDDNVQNHKVNSEANEEDEIEEADSQDQESEDEFEVEAENLTRKYNLDERTNRDSDDDALFKNNELTQAQLQKELKRMEMDDDEDDEGDDVKTKNDVEESENDEEFDKDMIYDDDEEEDETAQHLDPSQSNFERQNNEMRNEISKLEKEMLTEKPWQLKGEVDAAKRPQNSLLEEYVDFESGKRPGPLFTEEVAKRIEHIIVERIKDNKFDDVERKVKQVEQPFEYKRRIILDSEKSKSSLAQLYESEFLRQRDGEREHTEPASHVDIRQRMRRLFVQLDALCNYHYTPKATTSEMKIINNLPAISAEEAIPAAISDAQLVTPQEIAPAARRDEKGESERTKTDKLRERRLKKLKIKKRIAANKRSGKADPVRSFKNRNVQSKQTTKGPVNSKQQPKQSAHAGIQNAFLKLHKN